MQILALWGSAHIPSSKTTCEKLILRSRRKVSKAEITSTTNDCMDINCSVRVLEAIYSGLKLPFSFQNAVLNGFLTASEFNFTPICKDFHDHVEGMGMVAAIDIAFL